MEDDLDGMEEELDMLEDDLDMMGDDPKMYKIYHYFKLAKLLLINLDVIKWMTLGVRGI